ncbi:hypothetical protein ACWD8L_28600 [Streptomyces sp. NPDC005133]|uniref:hypothetical protein n=2 Tax=Streptomyces TaxID=1883 RepID=UPI0033AE65EF
MAPGMIPPHEAFAVAGLALVILSYGLGADSTAILLNFLADPAAPDAGSRTVVRAPFT